MKKYIYLLLLSAVSAGAIHAQNLSYAYLSGGCFWCTESDMEKITGVVSAESGYLGGKEAAPTYQQVSSGNTGHREGVKIAFDTSKVSYEELLEAYIRKIDPTDAAGSFVDRGFQYTAAIFYADEAQRKAAEKLLANVANLSAFKGKKLAVALLPQSSFYPAEDYHQDYYKKNSVKYSFYRFNSGRDQTTKALWEKVPSPLLAKGAYTSAAAPLTKAVQQARYDNFKKPSKAELKAKLSPLSYKVTQENDTERAFTPGNFNTEKRRGIYVDIISGEPLFSSADKFDSGTGWPSFVRPLTKDYIIEKADISIWGFRTEVRSKYSDSHLGHVFKDGPQPTGLRYCINGAALRFVPYENLDAEGYGSYKSTL